MADGRLNLTHGVLTIPAVVGLVVVGAISRFMPSAGGGAQRRSAQAQAVAVSAGPMSLTADHLLAEHLGVDDETPPDRLHKEVVDAAARHNTGVHFLIATVSDPVDSYETWQFDPQVDAIRQGIEASGYLFDRFYLPGIALDSTTGATVRDVRRLHERWPGIILFRWKSGLTPAPDSRAQSLLVTFLIPETPVAGIHQEPFRQALAFVHAWPRDPSSPDEDGIRILGPTYSGSTQSIIRGLVNFDRLPDVAPTPVTIVSGSASNNGNRTTFERANGALLKNLTLSFRATMQSNSAITKGLDDFLTDAGIDGFQASLAESSTAYGADLATQKNRRPPLGIKFPFNVAQLRRDASHDAPKTDAQGGSTLRPLSLDDVSVPTDQFPLQAPSITSSSVELVLSNMLDALRREHVRIIRLDATDVRDKLFLIKELRERAPDTIIVSTDADLFQVHPDQARWLRGLVVASTYPLHTSSQDLVYPFHGEGQAPRPNGELVQFPSANAQGYYNAAIALLNYDIQGPPKRRYAGMNDGYAALPKLIDYGGIGPGCGGPPQEPGVWISVVGDGAIVPLRVACRLDTTTGAKYVFQPTFPFAAGLPPSAHEIMPSRATALLIVFVSVASVLACLFAFVRGRNVGQVRLGAIALGLCGVLVPVAALGVIAFAAANELVHQDSQIVARWLAYLGAGACTGAVLYILAFQFRSAALAPVRVFFVVIAGMSAVYVLGQIDGVPQIFLLRALDVGTRMSPLVPLVAFGAAAVILGGVELRRLRAFGLGASKTDTPRTAADYRASWARCLDSIAPEASGGVEAIRDMLIDSHKRLFLLPGGARPREWIWVAAPFLVVAVTYRVVFPSLLHPILSVEGRVFGLAIVLLIVFLQWVFATALVQFLYLTCATAQLLARLGRHPDSLPWDILPKGHAPFGLVPTWPRLLDLKPLAAELPGGLATLQQDLDQKPWKRWFESHTWRSAEAEVARLSAASSTSAGPGVHARRLAAFKVVLVVRELLSRLSFNVLTMGPVLALLVTLYWTVYFDRSHALLGLIWFDVLLAMVAIMAVFIWFDRDAVVSGIRGTIPGEITWNWEFTSKILVYVVLPLLTLFATQFPEIGSGLLKFLEPVQQLPGS